MIYKPKSDVSSKVDPKHYNDTKIQPIDVISDWECNYNIGNVIKYCARYKKKGDAISDLEKAKKYLDFEIQTLKKGTKDEFK